jgi:hypothetical protein
MRMTLEDVAYKLLPRVAPGRALAHGEWLTLVNVAEVLLEGAPHKTSPERVADNIERFLVAGRSRRAWRVRLLLQIIEWSPLAAGRARFSALRPPARRTFIEDKWIADHRHVWRVCAKVRDLVVLGIYGDSRAGVQTGYVPVPLRPRFKHLSRPPATEVA